MVFLTCTNELIHIVLVWIKVILSASTFDTKLGLICTGGSHRYTTVNIKVCYHPRVFVWIKLGGGGGQRMLSAPFYRIQVKYVVPFPENLDPPLNKAKRIFTKYNEMKDNLEF